MQQEIITDYLNALNNLPLPKQLPLARNGEKAGPLASGSDAAVAAFAAVQPEEIEDADVRDVWFGVTCIYVRESQKDAVLGSAQASSRRSLGGALGDVFSQAQSAPEAASGAEQAYSALLRSGAFTAEAGTALARLAQILREQRIRLDYGLLLQDLSEWAENGFDAALLQRRVAEEMEERRLERYVEQAETARSGS